MQYSNSADNRMEFEIWLHCHCCCLALIQMEIWINQPSFIGHFECYHNFITDSMSAFVRIVSFKRFDSLLILLLQNLWIVTLLRHFTISRTFYDEHCFARLQTFVVNFLCEYFECSSNQIAFTIELDSHFHLSLWIIYWETQACVIRFIKETTTYDGIRWISYVRVFQLKRKNTGYISRSAVGFIRKTIKTVKLASILV